MPAASFHSAHTPSCQGARRAGSALQPRLATPAVTKVAILQKGLPGMPPDRKPCKQSTGTFHEGALGESTAMPAVKKVAKLQKGLPGMPPDRKPCRDMQGKVRAQATFLRTGCVDVVRT